MKIWVLNPPFLKKFSRPQRSPAVTKSGTIYFPIWQAFCVGVLEEAGHEVTFTDAPARGIERDDALKMAVEIAPRLIVLDTSTPSIYNDLEVAEELRKVLPDVFIVLTGTHVSALPEETLKRGSHVDAVARREFEYTVRDLADLLKDSSERPSEEQLSGIDGLSFRVGDKIVNNPDRAFIEDLDALPWVSKVYKKHLHIDDYFNQNAHHPMVTIITSRGCPFRCSFCVYPQTFAGHRFRIRSFEDVVDEMESIVKEFPDAKTIFFEDDTLTANKTKCIQFADAIIDRGLNISWTANSRIDLDLETMKKIKAAGCRELCVGFESGDQEVLDTMHKGTDRGKMLEFMDNARKAGILIHGCFIIGFPGETKESVLKTIQMSIDLKPDTVQFYPVMVYPGTEAYDDYKKRGWLTVENYSDWLTDEGLHNCVVRNETMDSAELVRLCDLARKKFYLRPGYILYKLCQIIKSPRDAGRTIKAANTFFKYLMFGSKV